MRTRLLAVSVRVLLVLFTGLLLFLVFLVLLLRSGNCRRRIRVVVNASLVVEVLVNRVEIVEDGVLTVIHARVRGDVVETGRVAHLMAHRMPSRRVTVVLAPGIEEGVIHLYGGRFNVITTVVEVEPRQPQPPLLGAVSPVAGLDESGDGMALLRSGPSTDD